MTVKKLLSLYLWLPGLLLVPLVTLAEPAREHARLGSEFDSYEAPSETPSDAALFPRAEEPTGELTLRDAVAAALLRNPELAVFSWEVRVREARAMQAGLPPNPALSVELENVGGSGDRSAFEQTETTLWLSQLLELAGKRTKRRQVADLQGDLARWDYENVRLSILTATTKAFVATLVAQKRLTLAEELERLARATVATVSAQVTAGAVPIVDKTRSEVVLLTAELERKRVERELAARRIALAATWGGNEPRFAALRGDLSDSLNPPPPQSEVERRIDFNPDIARWSSALAEREAIISLERSRRIPNPTFGLGGRYFSDKGDGALVFGLSMPIPVFNRNQGNTLAAMRDLSRTRAEKASAELFVGSALASRYQDLASAFEQALTLRERTLPAAERAFRGTRDGYRRGLFRYLDVLDAQRTLFELRARELEALSAFHQARADIERLTNNPLYVGEPNS
jgi:cobalt-zinc-cadmium efflux system outer membrane protein